MAYKRPQQWKKEESDRLRGERDQIKFIDLGFERWQVVRLRKQEEGNTFHCLTLALIAELTAQGTRGGNVHS